ncbi:MAG: phage holin family protein, partial [Chloroflexota bacterium]
YNLSLQDLIRQLAKTHLVEAVTESNESWGHVNVFLTDIVKHDDKAGKTVQRMVKNNMSEDEVQLGPDQHITADVPTEIDIVVLASGNLGLVYGTRREERITQEELEMRFPGLLAGLVAHEGIGWVMVKSAKEGPVVVGKNGRYYLASGKIEGDNPLAGFGSNAVNHLLRYDGFPDAPDLYINSFYDAEKNEVAAFEELIGCHGGMGGYQTQPFLLYPSDLQLAEPELIGAPAVYRQLKEWLRQTQGA